MVHITPASRYPVGSVIATDVAAYLRLLDGDIGNVWRCTDGKRYDHDAVNILLNSGAIVLREGK